MSTESPQDTSSSGIAWRTLFNETIDRLGSAEEARWVCQEVSGLEGTEWVLSIDALASHRAVARLDALVARRRAGEPLQYVLGRWAFRTLDLMVDRRVLIPRPETEEVAGAALEIARTHARPVTIVDLGTGSGAIALALAAELPRTGVEVWATDASADAVDVARANLPGVGRNGVNVRIEQGSWFDALPVDLTGRVDVLVSNPPYVATTDEIGSEVTEWEPGDALFAGPDGLDAIRTIVAGAGEWLSGRGSVVLEIGAAQGPAVAGLLTAAGFGTVEIRPDLSGRDRIAIARR